MKNLLKNKKFIIAAVIFMAAVISIIYAVVSINNYIDSISVVADIYPTQDGQVGIRTNLNQLKEKDIEYGDAVDVKFSTGYNAQFTPVVNGDFLNAGLHVLKATNPDEDMKFTIENNTNNWATINLDEQSTVRISLREKSKYTDLFKVSNMEITGDQKDLRSLRGGKLKFLDIFRGINPENNDETRISAKYFFRTLNITSTINLDNNDKNVHQIDIKNADCNNLIKQWLFTIADNQNHIFICSDKSDMTGYFCALIECISCATYDEIITDYMETYKNLYGVTKEEKPYEYNAIKKYHIDSFLHKLTKTADNYDMTNIDFGHAAEMYLRANGLKDADVDKIKARFIN